MTEPKAIGADDPDLVAGQLVGEYVIERQLGAGGFGTVYRAAHPLIGKVSAIKVLKRQYSAQPEMVSRFVAEARAVNQIRHRNIIDIFGFGRLEDGRHYYVMELLEGSTIDVRLATGGPIPLADAIPIFRSIARALDAAHAKGIAHRDLKPANVFLASEVDGTVFPKLLDFGIAKLLTSDGAGPLHKTRTGSPIGTPFYMSPEQCRGRDVDHRTDIYALGILVFEMLTGKLPFTGEDAMDVLFAQTNDAPPVPSSVNPALPESVDRAVSWMLMKEPAARPASAGAAIAALADAASTAGVPVAAATPSGKISGGGARTPGALASTSTTADRNRNVSMAQAATLDADRLTPPPAAEVDRSRPRFALIAGLALAALAVGGYLVLRDRGTTSTAGTSPDAAAAVAMPGSGTGAGSATVADRPDAAPAEPELVVITVVGPPTGTEVFGPGGKFLGVAPGEVHVPRGPTPLVLVFKADGHVTTSASVTPDVAKQIELQLVAKGGRPGRPGTTIRRPGTGSGSAAGSAGSSSGSGVKRTELPPDPFGGGGR